MRISVLLTALLMTASCGGASPKHHAHPSATSPTDTSAVSAPAAVPQLTGPYKVVAGSTGTPAGTWIFTPCGEGCADVEIGGEGSGQRATARYIHMNWTLELHSTGALQCGDGSYVPGTAHYTWNPDTLEGRYWSTSDSSHPCGYGQTPDSYPVPLTLTKAGP